MMKKTKTVIFAIDGVTVESIDGNDVTIDSVEVFKSAIAARHGIDYGSIEVIIRDSEILDESDLIVRADGSLMWQPKYKSCPIYVTGLSPSMDIEHEELFYEFLDLIAKKEFDKAIIFR